MCRTRPDAEAELAKMELVILYNTERYNDNDSSLDPIIRDSVITEYDFNPLKRYELKTSILRSTIDENRALYEKNTVNFYEVNVADLKESPAVNQNAYVAGSVGLSSDR